MTKYFLKNNNRLILSLLFVLFYSILETLTLLPSTSEYIVCTKVENQTKINAVLGFALFQMPSGIILLLSSGQIISLNLIIDSNLLPDWNIKNNNKEIQYHKLPLNSPIQKIMGESFVIYIQNILRKDVTQPILSLDKSQQPSIQECYELLIQVKQVLTENYLKKHEKAHNEIIKRIELLKTLKEKQKQEIEYLEKQKEQICIDAERLAEKCEDVNDRQQNLFKK